MKTYSIFNKLLFVLIILLSVGCDKTRQTLKEDERVPVSISPELGTGVILSGITALAFSPMDVYMAAGTGEGSMMIWELYRGNRIQSFRVGDNAITAASFSPPGKLHLAAGSSSGEITVWNFDTAAKPEMVLRIATASGIASIRYNETGSEIITLSNEGELCRWNSVSGLRLSGESAISAFKAAALGPEGKQAFYGRDDALSLADLPGGEERGQYSGVNGQIFAAAAGNGAFAASGKEGVQVWNANDGAEPKLSIKAAGNIPAMAINADETRLLTSSDIGVSMWNLKTGEEITKYVSFGTADEEGEWICMTPTGYYNASAMGAALMKVEAGGELYTMSQFSSLCSGPIFCRSQ